MTWRLHGTALLLLPFVAVAMWGCNREPSSEERPKAQAAGAAPQHYVTTAEARPVLLASATAAPKPAGPLPSNAACITPGCHASYATAPHIHGPVAARACDACHAADTGGHHYPLKRSNLATCTFCHAVAGTATHQHAALQQGCTSCHRPHESQAKYLLKTDTVERLCATCHDVPLKKYAHGPFAKGQCTLCHQPHQAENRMLLRGGDGPQHCYTCHTEMSHKMATAADRHKPATEQCTTCHNPHAADHEFQLKQSMEQTCLGCHKDVKQQVAKATVPHAAMLTAQRCGNCHDAHASADPKLLRQRMDRVCLTCHDKPVAAPDGRTIPSMKSQIVDAKFKHGPVRSGDCSVCHLAHGASQPNLLVRAFPDSFYTRFDLDKYALCFNCHERDLVLTPRTASLTNFRDGQENLHYVHVHRDEKGRTCRTCHAVHGSNLPKHMASEVPFEGSTWSMPIQYEATADGGRCAPGCHTAREYHRAVPTTGPTTRGER